MDEVQTIDAAARRVHAQSAVLDCDYLLLAAGTAHSYFGNDGWAPHAPGLRTIGEALEGRRRILRAFELAELSRDDRAAWKTFVVVGAGPTGVELAGAIAEMRNVTLVEEFRHIDTRRARVVLLEAGPRVLPTFAERCSDDAVKQLATLCAPPDCRPSSVAHSIAWAACA